LKEHDVAFGGFDSLDLEEDAVEFFSGGYRALSLAGWFKEASGVP
jgi:hypothetical protein